jgi:hypothetical protein
MRLITVLLAALAAGAAAAPGSAQPYPTYRGQHYFEDNTYSRKPRRGFSGHAGPPLLGYFCDYRRYPVRACDDRGRCKVVAWRLQQYCY